MYPNSRPTPPRRPLLFFTGLLVFGVATVALLVCLLVAQDFLKSHIAYFVAAYMIGVSLTNFSR